MKPLKLAEIYLVCAECNEEKPATFFEEPEAVKPQCNECQRDFWEVMGDDPHGKEWAS